MSSQEYNQRLVQLETKFAELEEKLNVKALTENLSQNLKNSIDDWLGNTLTVSCIKEEMERRYKRSRQELADFVKDFKKSEKEIRETGENLGLIKEEIANFKAYIGDIGADLKLKAYIGDVNRVERQLETKCSLNMVNDLAAQIKLKATKEELEVTNRSINMLREDIEQEYFKKLDALIELDKIKNNLFETFEKYSTKEETSHITRKFYKRTQKIDQVVDGTNTRIDSMQELHDAVIKEIRADLSSKLGQKELDKVSQEINSKASKQDLTKYFSELSPKVSGFQSELAVFNRIIREQEQALLRLDEVLLQKASKVETHDLYQKLALLSKHTDIEYKIDEMIKHQKVIRNEFNDIQSDVRQMQLQVSEIQTGYSKKVNENMEMKFLKELMLDMQTSISYKADRTEFLNCMEQKAGWGDFSHLSQSLESVHQQIKLLAVQVGAIEKISAPKGTLRNAERTQREYFNKITNRLVNYVVSSKPIIDEQPIPEEIKNFLKVPSTPKAYDNKRRVSTPHRRTYNSFDQLNNL